MEQPHNIDRVCWEETKDVIPSIVAVVVVVLDVVVIALLPRP
jgi:hypothetical protein